jgi:two-component system, response regulator PdtaR
VVPEASEPRRAVSVLVVEDDAVIGSLIAEMLEDMGYGVCAVEATETDAVAAAARYLPDLMIVDARLSEGSGVSAVAEILRSRFVPHLFITGNRAKVVEQSPGAIVLQKPFNEAELTRAIRYALGAPTLLAS